MALRMVGDVWRVASKTVNVITLHNRIPKVYRSLVLICDLTMEIGLYTVAVADSYMRGNDRRVHLMTKKNAWTGKRNGSAIYTTVRPK